MKRTFLLFAGSLMLFTLNYSCKKKGKNNPEACNGSSTRREIKLCTDSAAAEIDTIPIIASIDSLCGLDLIEAKSETERQDIEKQVFTITGVVDKVKKYKDGDYHIKLVDENENFINCEAPNQGCSFAAGSPFVNKFVTVRNWIEANEDDLEGDTLTITGVAFIDLDHHYPRNAAPNEFEIHPILDISF